MWLSGVTCAIQSKWYCGVEAHLGNITRPGEFPINFLKVEFMLGLALMGLGGLAAFICSIVILIAAFQDGVAQGLLCLFIPFYVLYYALAVFQHEKKGLILLGWLGGTLLWAIAPFVVAAG